MKTVLFTLALLISLCGYAQDNANYFDFIKKYETMKKFDIKRFEENKILNRGFRYLYTLDDGTKIEQSEDGNDYWEIVYYPNSAVEIHKLYYKTGELKGISKMFYSNFYGIGTEYDKQGNIIGTKDMTQDFAFKLEDLIAKIKHYYGIDLLIRQDDVFAYIQAVDPPFYKVLLSIEKRKILIVDGITGKVTRETNEKGEFGLPCPVEETAELVKKNRTEKDFVIKK